MKGKLVRDGIPDIIRARGGVPLTRIASPEEYRELLRAKLAEKAAEASEASDEQLTGVLADVLEVIRAIAIEAGISPRELKDIQAAKHAERGGFASRIVWMGNEDRRPDTGREAG